MKTRTGIINRLPDGAGVPRMVRNEAKHLASIRAGQKRRHARLVRISGEVWTVDEAMARSGLSRRRLMERLKEGRGTWEALADRGRA